MKKNSTVYDGRKAFVEIDLEALEEKGEVKINGVPFVADNTTTKVERQGFEITYLAYFCDLFEQLGGRKYKIFKYILENKESSNNSLIITVRELAAKTETSKKTVDDTLKLLREKGLIKTRVGSIMLMPKLSHRGSHRKEAWLMRKFEVFDEEVKDE